MAEKINIDRSDLSFRGRRYVIKEMYVGDLKFLEKYSGQSVDELIDMERDHRVDSLVLAFEQALEQKGFKKGDSSLSNIERTIVAIEAFEREVYNGGFIQLFTNTSKEFVPVIVDSLRRIGCPKAAELSEQAIISLGISGDINANSIDQAIADNQELISDVLESIDNSFYSLGENIAGCLFEYIKKHRNKIVLS